MSPITRRQFIGGVAGLTVAANAPMIPARGLSISPRQTWATDRPPLGPLATEDVRFLLVHHSASRNGHTGADAPAILRSFYDYHTSSEKGWNDIAYNFLIDSDGGIWEGRSGSLAGAVAGDATGGNQGFSQLVCVIGDYNIAQPSSAARASLVQILAWLADRHGVSTAPGAEVTFVSRGSNKWPEGTSVTTPTITGHRTMSQTTCPGEHLYSYVTGSLSADVEAVRGGSPSPTATSTTTTTSTPTTSTTTTVPSTTTTPPSMSTTTSTSTVPPTASTTVPPTTSTTTVPVSPETTSPIAMADIGRGTPVPVGLLATAGAMVVSGASLLLWRQRRMGSSQLARRGGGHKSTRG